ncbi:hypothetical protein Plec18167_000063 [Paecilomyces lecythidis]|uniref:DUF7371 domain-containing protein n=1 Tax=Paecilomyces lecythidis TaxID=3004212 RepID=A0ABR3YCU8_9EURO
MHSHLFLGLLLALLATHGSGGSVSKWSPAINWNSTSTSPLKDTATPISNVSLTAPVVLTHVATVVETVSLSPVTVTAITTVTDTVTFPLTTVYVTFTVVDPTLGCVIPLPTAPGNVTEASHASYHSDISTSSSEDYTVTSFSTSTETIQIISAPHLSPISEVTGVAPCNGLSSDYQTTTQPSETSTDMAATSTETITVWPVPEEPTSTKQTTTSVTSTVMNVVTDTLAPVPELSTSTAKKSATLRSSALNTSYQNVTYTSTASSFSASIFTPFLSIISLSRPAANRTLHVRNMPKREADTRITASINRETVSWEKKDSVQTANLSPITGKNPGGPAISAKEVTPSPITVSGSATSSPVIPTSPLTPCGETADFQINFDRLPTPPTPDLFPPIFNPYDHFFFTSGWSYGISFGGYSPASPPYLAVHQQSPSLGTYGDAAFSVGPRLADDRFWFNASSLFFGCRGPELAYCEVTVSAFKYSPQATAEYKAYEHHYFIPACSKTSDCPLPRLDLNSKFKGLTGMAFSATVANISVAWVIDDIQLGWYNNTCAAGEVRAHSM